MHKIRNREKKKMGTETIQIFKMTNRRSLETAPASVSGISKVKAIVDAKNIKGGLAFPLPDVFAAANGKADIAICVRASDGKEIHVAVPQGQRAYAQIPR